MKTLLKLFLLVAVVGGGWYAFQQYRTQEFLRNINMAFSVKPDPARNLLSLEMASASLEEVKGPNVYAFVAAPTLANAISSIEGVPKQVPSLGGIKNLTLSPKAIETADGSVAVTVDFDGTLEQPQVSLAGTINISAAPLLSGTNLDLLPLDASVSFRKVSSSGVTDEQHIPALLQSVTKPMVTYLMSRVGSVSIPMDLGIAKNIDLADALRDVKELKVVENGSARVYLSFDSAAVLATKEGLHLVGSAKIVSQQEMEIATNQMKLLAREVKRSSPAPAACVECQFSWGEVDKYVLCVRRRLDCQADRALGIKDNQGTRLSATQALALRELARATDSESRDTFETLKFLLVPSLRASKVAKGQDYASALSAVKSSLLRLRGEVEADAAFRSGESVVALRTELISNSVNQVASILAPKGTFAIDRRQEFFNETIKSPPPADLKCDQNQRGCPSNFDYPAYNPRGCDSNCGTRNCATIFGKEICVNGIDLSCQARKIDCERLKESERLQYEAAKATAQAKWSLAKLDCERLKETERIGCNINQEWLRAVGNQELGRVEGNAVVSDVRANIAYHGLQLSPSLDSFQVGIMAGGGAGVEASFVFTPLNAGHIACVAQWGGTVRANVALPPAEINLRAELDKQASKDAIVFKMQGLDVNLKMSPAPGVALLSQNPHMALVCPAVGALSAAAPLAVAIALPLLDTIPVKIPAREIRLPLFEGSLSTTLGSSKPELRFGEHSVLVAIK